MAGDGNEEYQISDELWEKINPLLPPDNNRSEMDKRKAMEAIFYVMRVGCEWEGIPRDIGIGKIHCLFSILGYGHR